MGRYVVTGESIAALGAGTPAGTAFNGYFGSVQAGSTANYKLRRIIIGVRDGGGVPNSQQMTVNIHRVTARATGSGFTTTVGQNMDPRGTPSAVVGLDLATAATAGTAAPVVSANPIGKLTFNTQSAFDVPFEGVEELICDQGTANGLAFVNIGNPLPASHLFTVDLEWEE